MNIRALFILGAVAFGFLTEARGQKVAVIAGDLAMSDIAWEQLYAKAGGKPKHVSRSELYLYDLDRMDAQPLNVRAGGFACAAFSAGGAELVVASHDSDENCTLIQVFETSAGKELRRFSIPDFRIEGNPTRTYEPHPTIRLANVTGSSQFALLGSDPRTDAARVGQHGSGVPGNPPCRIAILDSTRVLQVKTLPSTSSLFASFVSPRLSPDGAIVVSKTHNEGLALVQQLSLAVPSNLEKSGALLLEQPDLGYSFSTQDQGVVAFGAKLNLLRIPGAKEIAGSALTPSVLKTVDELASRYVPLSVIPIQVGEFIAFNGITKEGGGYSGGAESVLLNLTSGEARRGPKVSGGLMQARLSGNGKRIVVVARKSPQLVCFSVPELKEEASIELVGNDPSEVVVE